MVNHDYRTDEPTATLYAAGVEAFDNELFSDAKVTVGDKTWHVHKTILFFRSKWFRRAFDPPSAEANTNHVTITDYTAKAVGQVLYYIYTGLVDWEDLEDTRDHVDLFETAHFFDLGHVKNYVAWALHSHLESIARKTAENSLLLDNKEMSQLFHAASVAYKEGSILEALRHPIENFVVETNFLLCKDSRFQRQLKNIPELALALVLLMSSTQCSVRMQTFSQTEPEWCTACRSEKSKFAATSLVSYPEHDKHLERAIVGVCTDCSNPKSRDVFDLR
ncbi:hypothetical protein PG985_011319 [Apiospora marii]|uniref:BTB domain-containing protein n=1 Tax=Apiospora marii TaxID=335849 RepID=A0ABR1STB4_9PEZI